jgi:hypothetical protein
MGRKIHRRVHRERGEKKVLVHCHVSPVITHSVRSVLPVTDLRGCTSTERITEKTEYSEAPPVLAVNNGHHT